MMQYTMQTQRFTVKIKVKTVIHRLHKEISPNSWSLDFGSV